MEWRDGWRTIAETAAVVPALAAFLWACYEALMTWLVVAADEFPQCSEIRPDKALLVLISVAVAALAVASLVLVVRRRKFIAYGCVLVQIPLAFAWMEVDGGAAGCLIG